VWSGNSRSFVATLLRMTASVECVEEGSTIQ